MRTKSRFWRFCSTVKRFIVLKHKNTKFSYLFWFIQLSKHILALVYYFLLIIYRNPYDYESDCLDLNGSDQTRISARDTDENHLNALKWILFTFQSLLYLLPGCTSSWFMLALVLFCMLSVKRRNVWSNFVQRKIISEWTLFYLLYLVEFSIGSMAIGINATMIAEMPIRAAFDDDQNLLLGRNIFFIYLFSLWGKKIALNGVLCRFTTQILWLVSRLSKTVHRFRYGCHSNTITPCSQWWCEWIERK